MVCPLADVAIHGGDVAEEVAAEFEDRKIAGQYGLLLRTLDGARPRIGSGRVGSGQARSNFPLKVGA